MRQERCRGEAYAFADAWTTFLQFCCASAVLIFLRWPSTQLRGRSPQRGRTTAEQCTSCDQSCQVKDVRHLRELTEAYLNACCATCQPPSKPSATSMHQQPCPVAGKSCRLCSCFPASFCHICMPFAPRSTQQLCMAVPYSCDSSRPRA